MQERTARVGSNVDMTGSFPRSPRRTAVNLGREDEALSSAATISSILESSTVDEGGNWHPPDGAGARLASAELARADGLSAAAIAARIATILEKLLAAIRNPLERLATDAQGPLTSGQGGLIASALSKATRADRLAADLLAYGKGQRLKPDAVELSPLLLAVADTLRRTLDKRIDVTVHVDDNCPPCHVDAHALEEALIHLAINARDAMPDGGHLRLGACAAEQPTGVSCVQLTVTDSGRGMSSDVARRAALPFFTTKIDEPLAGLGLAAVEGFAQQSGGLLELRTSSGIGTSAMLRLPSARGALR
jgi:signal transduction histidine kinase